MDGFGASFGGNGLLIGLAAAFFFFALSTFQMAIGLRFVIWLIGAGLVAASVVLGGSADRDGLLALVEDGAKYGESGAWAQALAGNQQFVFDYLSQMRDVFAGFGALFGLAALIALLPGETFDRMLRPVIVGVSGMVIGALATVAIVAIGFGGYPERQVYVGAMGEPAGDLTTGENPVVIDGDTFRFGEFLVRLAWVDAPEFQEDRSYGGYSVENQMGVDIATGEMVPLGTVSRDYLAATLAGALTVCERTSEIALRDKWGRSLLNCLVRPSVGEEFDLAVLLLQEGIVSVYPDMPESHPRYPAYHAAQAEARAGGLGIWATCTLAPRVWRNSREDRNFFLQSGLVRNPADALGYDECQAASAILGVIHPVDEEAAEEADADEGLLAEPGAAE